MRTLLAKPRFVNALVASLLLVASGAAQAVESPNRGKAGKVLVIMRGLSGSGKSTLARKLGQGGVVLATDDFFEQAGSYHYDPSRVGTAHAWNQARAEAAMAAGVSPVVIDNTHTQAWEAKPYVEMGVKGGYRITFREPQTPWKFDPQELARRNKHGVSEAIIRRMLERWEPKLTVKKVLASQRPH